MEHVDTKDYGYQINIKDLVRCMPDGVLMFDKSKKVIIANQAISQMTGLPQEGFYIEEFIRLVSQESQAEIDVDKVLNEGSTIHLREVCFVEMFYYETFIVPVYDANKEVAGGVIILHDITVIKEAEKLKEDFISITSHQLKTPLTAINWYIEMLLDGDAGALQEKQTHFLQEASKTGYIMMRMINDLLNISRLEGGRIKITPERSSLRALVEDVVKEADPLAKKKVCSVVINETSEHIPDTDLDVNLIRQVIHNLITNAIKYSKEEGGQVEVNLSYNEREYLLVVKDNGVGIPEKDKSKIFKKFFRAGNVTSTTAEGTGLGLFIAKMIVDTAGGKIWFESVEGKGTSFSFTLPAEGMKLREGDRGLA